MRPTLTFSFLTGTLVAVAATAFVLDSKPAVAEQSARVMEEIVVEVPAVVTSRTFRDREHWRHKTKAWEAKIAVEYADLDLALHDDVIVLEMRIESAAKAICEQLADLYPRLRKPEPGCVRDAVASTRGQLKEAIAAAS